MIVRLILVSETRFPYSRCWRLGSSGFLTEVTDTERSFETSGIINAAVHSKQPQHLNPVSELLNSSLSNAQHMQRRTIGLLVND